VIKADGQTIDEESTRALFQHPAGVYSAADGNVGAASDFRPVGRSISIFSYVKRYYFDTFFDEAGDFENGRKGSKSLRERLGVFAHDGGRTHQVCEFSVSEEPMASSGASSED